LVVAILKFVQFFYILLEFIKCLNLVLPATTWEIKRLNTSESTPKCIVTRMVEISPCFWDRWRRRTSSNFERSIPFALLSQVAGLREYFAANPAITPDLPSTVVKSKVSESLIIQSELEYSEPNDEFYDALVRGESFEG
uniref:Uncharacterized protein n=1 Tax=Aegilops tauschii subsp. strangulata TaxID=200361 RepID=A0A453KJ10_AEGTS